jgi:hypothetical protein
MELKATKRGMGVDIEERKGCGEEASLSLFSTWLISIPNYLTGCVTKLLDSVYIV